MDVVLLCCLPPGELVLVVDDVEVVAPVTAGVDVVAWVVGVVVAAVEVLVDAVEVFVGAVEVFSGALVVAGGRVAVPRLVTGAGRTTRYRASTAANSVESTTVEVRSRVPRNFSGGC